MVHKRISGIIIRIRYLIDVEGFSNLLIGFSSGTYIKQDKEI